MPDLYKHKWIDNSKNQSLVPELSELLNVDQILVQIILNRGFVTKEQIEGFLYPSIQQVTQEFCPKNIEKATARVISAINNKEKICVFGDYDADGVTGTVLLVDALRQLGGEVSYYVPLRYTEGYGMNLSAVRLLHEQGIQLIVTVDCGISNYDEIVLAKELGIDVVVTDHHTPPVKLPPAVALINPKLEHKDDNTFLAGVGVAYKFLDKLFLKFQNNSLMMSKKYIELVAIGTITDVVPLLGENRVFVTEGLKKLNGQKSLGLQYLLEKMGFQSKVDSFTIGFGIGPRLNAAGRLDSAKVAIDLLKTKSKVEAKALSEELHQLNERRKIEGNAIHSQSVAMVEKDHSLLNNKVLVLSSDKWEAGVIGIVSSQLAKKYERPVVLISVKGEVARGSIRSFANVDIFNALDGCKEYLLNFGGHKEAAGFEIAKENIADFKSKYIAILDSQLSEQDLKSEILIDKELTVDQINVEMIDALKVLEPYGEANREPIFITKGLSPVDYGCVGKDKAHLRVLFEKIDSVSMDDYQTHELSAIGFNMSEYKQILDNNTVFDVVYNLVVNDYYGKTEPQLRILDIRPSQE
jgi:single-stranded-DNA-specific exonuclease